MRQLFILLAFLCLWSSSVLAIDVSIPGSQQANFNPASVGSDVTLNIGVTNASTAITSAALFRSAWIGQRGFTVTLAGVRYQIANVADTSNATLTTPYAATTGTVSGVWHKYIELRWYSNISFRPAGKLYTIQAGVPGSSAWFARYAGSIINISGSSTLFWPDMTIDSTVDSIDNNQARYTLGLYRTDGSSIQFYTCSSASQLRIPANTPTNLADICIYNSSAVVPFDNTAYTRGQIDARFPSCFANNLDYFATTGNAKSCLTVGAGLSIASGTISATVSGPPGSNTQVIFNDLGSFGADPDFIWDKTTNGLLVIGTVQATALGLGVAPSTATPFKVTQAASTSGSPSLFTITGGAHTTLAADTEATDLDFNLARNVQFNAGGATFSLERAVRFRAPTYRATSAETILTAVTLDANSPIAGTNMTFTDAYVARLTPSATAHGSILMDHPSSATGRYLDFQVNGSRVGQIKAAATVGNFANFVLGNDSLGTSEVDGFVYYPSMAGVPAGTPTSFGSGVIPTVIDRTNSRFYAYISGAWSVLGAPPGGSDGNLQYRVSATSFGGVAGSAITTLGEVDLNNTARTSGGSTRYFRVRTPADTGLTASTESIGIQIGGNVSAATVTRQFATGALATQRENLFVAPTYGFTSASTLTDGATVAISGAVIPGANATITNPMALWVQGGKSAFAGFVGLGTTGPTYPLDIRSADTAQALVRMQHTSSSGFNTIDYFSSAGVQAFGVGFGNGAVASPFTSTPYLSVLNGFHLQVTTAAATTSTARWAFLNGGDLVGNSAVIVGWSNTSTDPTATRDAGFKRNASGVVEVLASGSTTGSLITNNLTVNGKPFSIAKFLTKDSTIYATGANTTETDLATYTYAIAAFATNNDFSVFQGRGLTGLNGNTKRIRAYVGGTLVLDTGAIAYAGGWDGELKIIRLSSTTVRVETRFLSGTNAGTIDNNSVNLNTITPVTVSNLDSNTLLVKFTGQNGSATANDITQNWLDVSMVNF